MVLEIVNDQADDAEAVTFELPWPPRSDPVIGVDTMIHHWAGARGRPVWTLLHSRADWRWMLDRPDSPWYPTMRLFRQPAPGDWSGVIERVKRELKLSS